MHTTRRSGARVAALAFFFAATAVSAEKVMVTGVVGDAMCGVKHSMGGNDADCTKECVKGGASDYALIVDDKALTLKAPNENTKAELNKLAGKKATVSGERNGDTITVSSVQAAK